MAPATLDRVTDNLCRLIGVACGMAADAQPDAVREARDVEVRQSDGSKKKQYVVQALAPAAAIASCRNRPRSSEVNWTSARGTLSASSRRRRAS